ncbi:unnamed protein product [Darwinula stevensoni]|uniref:G-patch domain-containing protein n=1 Tax=Darwinula stevensoni TaxID=69355 RepID=A0A7R8XEA6_9CRUS|nr:unnamed protein product [Darwinula stevensoni]CAG0890419.1 unnamed protein product [Darwinula stevensoni]
MAMLAEPRRRNKWSLNPRGKLWSQDDSKFGQKMLEKMGWKKGDGLGRKKQGEVNPLRIDFKDDNKDDSKFGQKMLEKMGWKKGDGLGRKKQGEVNPLRIDFKDDNKG